MALKALTIEIARVDDFQSARLDIIQSLTGFILGIFLIAHLHFESSILLGKDTFFYLVQFLEGSLFSATEYGWHWVTQAISAFMFLIVILHAFTALRRFPVQCEQWNKLKQFKNTVIHKDTQIWKWQLFTGFGLFFLVPVHLLQMLLNPEIGPNLSAARVYFDKVWLLYIVFLPLVVIHGVFGLYRVLLKWGIVYQRQLLYRFSLLLIIYLLVLGGASLVAYLHLGSELTLPVTPYKPVS